MSVLLVVMTLVVNIFEKEKTVAALTLEEDVYVEETTFEEAEEDDNRENDS